MTKTSKPKQVFTATAPDAGEAVSISTARDLQWATWGYEELEQGALKGAWVHLGWSTRSSQVQAESSAQSTGPYFHRWMATPVAIVPPIPGIIS